MREAGVCPPAMVVCEGRSVVRAGPGENRDDSCKLVFSSGCFGNTFRPYLLMISHDVLLSDRDNSEQRRGCPVLYRRRA